MIEMFLERLKVPECISAEAPPEPPVPEEWGTNLAYWPGGWRRLSRIPNLFDGASRSFSGTWAATFPTGPAYGILSPGQSATLVLDCGVPISPMVVIGWVPEWSDDGVTWNDHGTFVGSSQLTSGGVNEITNGDTLVPNDKRIIYNQSIADEFVDPMVTTYVDGINGEHPGFTRVLRNWAWSPESGVPYVWLYGRVSARYWRFVYSVGSTYTGSTPGLNTTTVSNLMATPSTGGA